MPQVTVNNDSFSCNIKLSPAATHILNNVISAMQDAEEIGGPEGVDYANLMQAIALEAIQRIVNFQEVTR